jgi:hypothetical protein
MAVEEIHPPFLFMFLTSKALTVSYSVFMARHNFKIKEIVKK